MSYSQCKCIKPTLQGDVWCRSCGGMVEMGEETSRINKEWFLNEMSKTAPKTGRNDLCPCLSGKKYKQCCLK